MTTSTTPTKPMPSVEEIKDIAWRLHSYSNFALPRRASEMLNIIAAHMEQAEAVAWQYRDNSWPEDTWAYITQPQYANYLNGPVTGPRESWNVRQLFTLPKAAP